MLCASPYVTTVLFCIKETQGRNQRFSSQVRMILRRSILVKFLLLISMLALVQVFENNITACRVNTPFSCVLLYHTTSAFSTYALIEVLITFPQSCSRLKLAKFLSF